jgi:hypothetical protein
VYIVALAWIYVVLMVSIMQPTVFKGIVTFLGTGVLPLALFLYLMGTPQRRRNLRRAEAVADADVHSEPGTGARSLDAPNGAGQPDRADATQSGSSQINDAKRPVTPSRR